MKRQLPLIALSLSFLYACQAQPTQSPQALQAPQPQNLAAPEPRPAPQNPSELPVLQAEAQVKNLKDGFADVELRISLDQQGQDFKTQAFNCGSIEFYHVTIQGLGIASPILPSSPTPNGSNNISRSGCDVGTVNFTNVPVGAGRVIEIQALNASQGEITGLKIMGITDVTSVGSTPVEISFRSTPEAAVLLSLMKDHGAKGEALVSRLDQDAFSSFIDGIMGPSQTSSDPPAYTYTVHPTLVKTDEIASALVNNDGDVSALVASNYVDSTASVSGLIVGIDTGDNLDYRVGDPISTPQSEPSPGAHTFSFTVPGVAPGTWQLNVDNTDTLQTQTRTVNAGDTGVFIDFYNLNPADWNNNGPNGGGLVYDVIRSGSTVYAGTERGVYLSTDGGTSWSFSGLHDQKVLSLSFGNDNTEVFAGTENSGIYFSLDSGSNWNQATTANDVNSLKVNSILYINDDSDYIYAATNDGVLEAVDGAPNWNSWTKVNTVTAPGSGDLANQEVTDLVSFGLGGPFFISVAEGAQAGVFRSTDPATNGWTPFVDKDNDGPGSGDLNVADQPTALLAQGSNIFVGTRAGTVAFSQRDTLDWTTPSGSTGAPVNALEYNGTTGDYIAATEGGAMRTAFFPSTTWSWSEFSAGNAINNPFVTAVDTSAAASGNNGLFVATKGGGVSETSAGSFAYRNAGLHAAIINDIALYTPFSSVYKFVATEGGSVLRFDPIASPGMEWEALLGLAPNMGKERYIKSVAVDNNGTLYAGYNGGLQSFEDADSAAASTNWTDFTGLGTIPNSSEVVAIDTTSSQVYAAVKNSTTANAGLYRSSCLFNSSSCVNGSWTQVRSGTNFTAVAHHPSNDAKIYAGDANGNMHISSDSGTSWSTQNNVANGPIVDISVPNWSDYENDYFIVADLNGNPQVRRFDSANATWRDLNGNLPAESTLSLIADPEKPSVLYVGTKGAGVYRTSAGLSSAAPNWDTFNASSSPISFGGLGVRSLAYDDFNQYLVGGTDGAGLFKTDASLGGGCCLN